MGLPHPLQPVQHTQVHESQRFPLTLVGAGAAAPTLGPGDPNGAYFTTGRSAAGKYTLTTKHTYAKCLGVTASYQAATPTGAEYVELGVPAKNSDNTWTIPITTWLTGTGAADLPTTDRVALTLEMSASTVVP